MSTETTEHVYTTNAPKGAAKLDDEFPGWADRIDRGKFNIRSYGHCAAAQIAGKGWYWDGLKELFPAAMDEFARHDKAREYGFFIDVSADDLGGEAHADQFVPMWDVLQAEWENLIDARRTV